MTDDLIEFIQDRLAYDEQLAGEHHLGQCTRWIESWRLVPGPCNCYGPSGVRRAVAAKRLLLNGMVKTVQGDYVDYGEVPLAEWVLGQMASEWSNHPDYRPAWAA